MSNQYGPGHTAFAATIYSHYKVNLLVDTPSQVADICIRQKTVEFSTLAYTSALLAGINIITSGYDCVVEGTLTYATMLVEDHLVFLKCDKTIYRLIGIKPFVENWTCNINCVTVFDVILQLEIISHVFMLYTISNKTCCQVKYIDF